MKILTQKTIITGLFATTLSFQALASSVALTGIINGGIDSGDTHFDPDTFDLTQDPPDGNFDFLFDNFQRTGYQYSPRENIRWAIEFDLSALASLPIGATIDSFTFYAVPYGGGYMNELHGYQGDGSITLDDMDGGTLLGSFDTGSGAVSQDVSSFVGDLLSNGHNWAGFNLRQNPISFGEFDYTITDWADNSDAQNFPRLIVNYSVSNSVPDAGSTMALLSLSGAALLALRRHKIV